MIMVKIFLVKYNLLLRGASIHCISLRLFMPVNVHCMDPNKPKELKSEIKPIH